MDKHMLSHKIDFVIINPLSYPSLFMFGGGSRLSFMYIDWSWGIRLWILEAAYTIHVVFNKF
jgi:hypothetical protein